MRKTDYTFKKRDYLRILNDVIDILREKWIEKYGDNDEDLYIFDFK